MFFQPFDFFQYIKTGIIVAFINTCAEMRKQQHGKCMLLNETKPSVGMNDCTTADNKC